jgi:hypothetical protein
MGVYCMSTCIHACMCGIICVIHHLVLLTSPQLSWWLTVKGVAHKHLDVPLESTTL